MGFGDFFDKVWDKTKGTAKAAGQAFTIPIGVALDLARYAPLTPNDMGPDWLGVKTQASASADLLLGNGTLTGWAITKTGEGLNYATEKAENTLEAGWYSNLAPVPALIHRGDDPVSWSEAWDLAETRSLGDTAQLAANEIAGDVNDATGVDVNAVIRGVPLVGSYLGAGGVGADDTKNIKAADADAWAEFHKHSPFWSGAASTGINATAIVAADPFLLAGRLTQAPRALRSARGIRDGEEVGLAERMATEKSHKILGIPSKKAGLQSRTDPLIGTVKYEDEMIDGKRVVDGDGNPYLVPVQGKENLGWLDGPDGRGLSNTKIITGLGLKSDPYGDHLATALERTILLKNPADKVNVRRDILAARAGDADAFGRLTANPNAKEFAYSMSNMARGRGTGELEMALADDAANAAGKVTATHYSDPEAVAGIVDELHAQNGFADWIFANNKARTLIVSPKGNRALARLAGQGLGRDGTLHTGRTGFDDIVNSKILGKFKSDGSVLDEGIAKSDELAEGTPLRDSKVYEADHLPWSVGSNLQPATFVRGGIKVAGWATVTPFLKAGAKASDALRSKVITGALNVEDAPLTIAVTEGFLKGAGVAAPDVDRLMSSVISASGPTPRAIAVQKAEDHAVGVLADRYGVDRAMVAKIQEHHALKRDAVMAAARGQSYSAHKAVDEVTGAARQGDMMYLPDEGGAMVLPILDTQTINNMPLLDLDYVETWLKRSKMADAVGNAFAKVGKNPQTARANELGFNSRVNSMLESDMRKWGHFVSEETNAWWKRGVLLLRAPAYATRNTAEEMMRVSAVGDTALTADAAARHGAHRAADHARRSGNAAYNDLAPEYATLELRKSELENVRSLRDDPEIVANVKAVRSELSALKSKRTKLLRSDAGADTSDLDSSISWIEEMPYIVEHGAWVDEVTSLEQSIKALDEGLKTKVLPDSGFLNIDGVQYPDAFQGISGKMAYERVANSGAFDAELTELSQRSFGRQRGVGESNIISPATPGDLIDRPDVAARHLTALAWVLNKQIGQDVAGRVALRGMAEEADDIAPRVKAFLDSPEGSQYVRNNPHRAYDTEAWADEITAMVQHHAVDSTTAQRVLEGEVSKGELAELWPDELTRPEVHAAGVDGLMGVQNRKFATWTGQKFKQIDKMSVNAITRHPYFSVQFRHEVERLHGDFARKVELEHGPDATVSLDDINNITERARKVAANRVRQTFYDTSSRSSAAQKLRFIYPFFAAHQNSMQFWGTAIAQNPNVLRAIQLGFQTPASLGLVVDREGNPVPPGEFIKNDHQIVLQVPKAWGGPDLSDPSSKQGGFRISLNSLNLIMPGGSVLNPGAGPMASIPAGYVQKKWGSQNDDVAKMLTWFNPFGAPKQGDSDVLPGMLQGLTPALPTPLVRLGTAWDAFMGDKNSREYTEMWSLRFQEAQVKFAEENERQPTKTEAADMEKQVDQEVRHMAGLRFVASFVSPAQPQPSSRLSGFIAEYRKLQEIGRNEDKGAFWASDTFLDKYGDAYMALTRSTSESRGNLDPTTHTVRTLNAHSKLVDKTAPETWRLIVGGEGDSPDVEGGAFSINAYRWMQDKSVSKVYGGGKLIQRKDAGKNMFSTNAASGWREFSKYKDILLAQATQAGFPSIDKSPQLKQMKSDMVNTLKEKYPDWFQEYTSGADDYDNTYMDSIRTIATDKKLLSDPARQDIVQLKTYVEGRDAVFNLLKQRDAAGGSADPKAVSNRDVAYLFAQLVDQLAESNTSFSTYAIDGIISRDPLYRAGLDVGGQ